MARQPAAPPPPPLTPQTCVNTRFLLGWSQDDLAKKAGLPHAAIRAYEGGLDPIIITNAVGRITAAFERADIDFSLLAPPVNQARRSGTTIQRSTIIIAAITAAAILLGEAAHWSAVTPAVAITIGLLAYMWLQRGHLLKLILIWLGWIALNFIDLLKFQILDVSSGWLLLSLLMLAVLIDLARKQTT
jgi:transcriptional regulator with XRE-family HTH domain